MISCIIAGSRHLKSYDLVKDAVNESGFKIDEVICGEANGIDTCGRLWAVNNKIPIKSFPADWNTYGRAAGHIRNAQMGRVATHLIIIWDGVSKGSAGMLKIAKEKGLTIFEKIVK